MLFSRRDHEGKSHWLRTTRDVVEIVAIIAAGFWAFYIFAYENRIKPSLASPDVNYVVTLERVGAEHNGLIGVRLRNEIKNVGSVKAHFLGFAVWVYGRRVTLLKDAQQPDLQFDRASLHGFYRESPPTAVYGNGYVTALGNPKTPQDLELDPGSETVNETIFYVPAHKFDLLEVYVDSRYTKNEDRTNPTKLEFGADGLPKIVSQYSDTQHFATFVSRLDLSP